MHHLVEARMKNSLDFDDQICAVKACSVVAATGMLTDLP